MFFQKKRKKSVLENVVHQCVTKTLKFEWFQKTKEYPENIKDTNNTTEKTQTALKMLISNAIPTPSSHTT